MLFQSRGETINIVFLVVRREESPHLPLLQQRKKQRIVMYREWLIRRTDRSRMGREAMICQLRAVNGEWIRETNYRRYRFLAVLFGSMFPTSTSYWNVNIIRSSTTTVRISPLEHNVGWFSHSTYFLLLEPHRQDRNQNQHPHSE